MLNYSEFANKNYLSTHFCCEGINGFLAPL